MKLRQFTRLSVAVLLLVMSTLLAACGGSTATPSPVAATNPPTASVTNTAAPANTTAPATEAVAPPTNTTAPPTDTLAPPTNTVAPPTNTPAPPAKQTYGVGDTAQLGNLRVTLNDVKTSTGTSVFKPKANMQYVIVNVTFENVGASSENVSSLLQMDLKDATGQAYSIDLGATSAAGGKQPDGAIAAGDKLRGPIGYEVPKDVQGLQWIFKDVLGDQRVVFDLAKKGAGAAPNATAAPAPTSASSTKQTYGVGDTAQLGNLRVTLNEAKTVPGTDFFKPDAGMRFIVVNVTFENVGTASENVSSMLQMELKDATGQAYSIDLGAPAAAGGKQPDGTIAAGDKLRGPIGYQVPKDAQGLQWIFKEAFGDGRVVFDIKP